MKKVLKWVAMILIIVLVCIQFFRPAKNIYTGPDVEGIATRYAVPPKVMTVLQRSCYDCHSNNTIYPLYSHVQPFAWYLADHVEEGKRELNFSGFATYSPKKAAHKLDEITTETGQGDMPLSSYTLIHRNAVLSDEEVKLLTDWTIALSDSISKAYQLPAH